MAWLTFSGLPCGLWLSWLLLACLVDRGLAAFCRLLCGLWLDRLSLACLVDRGLAGFLWPADSFVDAGNGVLFGWLLMLQAN